MSGLLLLEIGGAQVANESTVGATGGNALRLLLLLLLEGQSGVLLLLLGRVKTTLSVSNVFSRSASAVLLLLLLCNQMFRRRRARQMLNIASLGKMAATTPANIFRTVWRRILLLELSGMNTPD